jgi:proteic killer suppression protein
LFGDQAVPRFRAIERLARRKLLLLHRAIRLDDLRAPPAIAWKRLGRSKWSIRIND